jgi:hypothetical protein
MAERTPPVLITRVAHCGYGDTEFCGYNVRRDLVGKSGYWNSISLALDGPRLSSDQEAVLDGLAVASLNADPRVWPLRLARLLASYGSVSIGVAGSIIAMEGGFVAGPAIGGAAQLLVELGNITERGALEAEVSRRLEAGHRLMGYGVPNRDRDERVLALMPLVDKHNLAAGHFWQLAHSVEAVAVTKKQSLKLNIGAASSAIYLDMGFHPEQIGMLATLMLLNNIVANAHEGATQAEPMLLELPREFVTYYGPASRLSPRAIAKKLSVEQEPSV